MGFSAGLMVLSKLAVILDLPPEAIGVASASSEIGLTGVASTKRGEEDEPVRRRELFGVAVAAATATAVAPGRAGALAIERTVADIEDAVLIEPAR
jgi:hypothetical protein